MTVCSAICLLAPKKLVTKLWRTFRYTPTESNVLGWPQTCIDAAGHVPVAFAKLLPFQVYLMQFVPHTKLVCPSGKPESSVADAGTR